MHLPEMAGWKNTPHSDMHTNNYTSVLESCFPLTISAESINALKSDKPHIKVGVDKTGQILINNNIKNESSLTKSLDQL